jgi:hypothetical protein
LANNACAPFVAIHGDNGEVIKVLKKEDYIVQ